MYIKLWRLRSLWNSKVPTSLTLSLVRMPPCLAQMFRCCPVNDSRWWRFIRKYTPTISSIYYDSIFCIACLNILSTCKRIKSCYTNMITVALSQQSSFNRKLIDRHNIRQTCKISQRIKLVENHKLSCCVFDKPKFRFNPPSTKLSVPANFKHNFTTHDDILLTPEHLLLCQIMSSLLEISAIL